MLEEKISIVHMNDKNYTSQEFQYQMFVKGKELWNHLDGSSTVPTDPNELGSWESKVVSWLLSSIEPFMVNNRVLLIPPRKCEFHFSGCIIKITLLESFKLELEIGNYCIGN